MFGNTGENKEMAQNVHFHVFKAYKKQLGLSQKWKDSLEFTILSCSLSSPKIYKWKELGSINTTNMCLIVLYPTLSGLLQKLSWRKLKLKKIVKH